MAHRPIHPIILRRHLVLVITRIVAALLIVLGAVSLTYSVVNGVSLGASIRGMFFMYDKTNYGALAFGLLVPGIGLALASSRVARWVVPAPRDECPRCGYALRSLTGDRCPECGLILAAAAADAERNA